jgi:ASPIC/UnbV protein/VCBS repeat protein
VSSSTAAEEEHIYTDAFVGENSWNGRERNVVLLNRGDGRFLSAAPALGLDDLRDARGLALADFDLDGDLDLAINNYLAPAALYLNQRGSERSWIAFRLRAKAPNLDAVGAILRFRAGGRLHTRLVGAGHGYASQFSLEQHVGLGQASGPIQELRVSWPDGTLERFGPLSPGQRYSLEQGQGLREFRPGEPIPRGWSAPPVRAGAGPAAALALVLLLSGVWFLGSPASAVIP